MSEPIRSEGLREIPKEPWREFFQEWRWVAISGLALVALGLFGPHVIQYFWPATPSGISSAFVFVERVGEACIIAMLVGRLVDFPSRLYATRTIASDITTELDEARRRVFGILHDEAIVKRVIDITQQERVLRDYLVEYSFEHLPASRQVRVTVEYSYTPINLTSRIQKIYSGEVLGISEQAEAEMLSMSIWQGNVPLFSYDKTRDNNIAFRTNAKTGCIEWRVENGFELPPLTHPDGQSFRVRYRLVKLMKEVDRDFVVSYRSIENPKIEIRERGGLWFKVGDTPHLKEHEPLSPQGEDYRYWTVDGALLPREVISVRWAPAAFVATLQHEIPPQWEGRT